jgi:hypothetical protein
MVIKQIALPSRGADKVAYAIEVPQATERAPHQSHRHIYYKRFNFESVPMEDYEVRDLMRRSIEYGRKFGAAWELDVEVKRLLASIEGKQSMPRADWHQRSALEIAVSNDLRSAGDAMQLFNREVRESVAALIADVDRYNASIQTTTTVQGTMGHIGGNVCLGLLEQAQRRATEIITAVKPVLDAAPT